MWLNLALVERLVQDELLDSLPFDHSESLRSRRDLRWLNALMGNHRWVKRSVSKIARDGDKILELGAGHGELSGALRGIERDGRRIQVDGLDLCPQPLGWPIVGRWWRRDALAFDEYGQYDGIVANLLLHQFEDEELAELGGRLAEGPRFIIACEPARRALHLAQLTLLGCCGLGRVTRHDGAISIRAGFLGDELPRLLKLEASRWRWRCATGWRGQYAMVAQRR